MPKTAAGLLLFRRHDDTIEVLLVHPGGPFWARQDLGAWAIPKGEVNAGEELLAAARREFREETGADAPGAPLELGQVRQGSGKVVHAWAVEGEFDPARLSSNMVTREWPKGSGRRLTFPEVDQAAWFPLDEARRRILPAQAPFLDALEALVRSPSAP